MNGNDDVDEGLSQEIDEIPEQEIENSLQQLTQLNSDNADLRIRDDEDIKDYDSDEDEGISTGNQKVGRDKNGLPEVEIDADATVIFAKMFLLLGTQHFATEPILQGLIHGMSSGFDSCKRNFLSNISESNFQEEEKKEIMKMFQKSFSSFTEPFDLQRGSLRNRYFREKYYRNHFNFIHPIEMKLTKETDMQSNDQKTSYLSLCSNFRNCRIATT